MKTSEHERPRVPGGPVEFEPDWLRLVQEMPAGPIKVVTAISWCTTHDASKVEAEWMSPTCGAGLGDCLISTGGPDHKWWKDQ